MKEQVFDAGNVQIHYATGPDSGPPIVLLHGVVRSWQDWLPMVPSLSARWSVHALDLRGHGLSSRVAGKYRVVDYAPDVLAFLRGALSGPAVLLGHSLGAMVAVAAAAEAPECVRAVVLEDPPFDMMGSRLGETSYFGLFRAYQALAGSSRSVEEIAATLAEVPVRLPGEDRTVPLGELRDPVALRVTAWSLRRLDPDVLRPVVEGLWLDGYETDALLGRVICPALLLQADYAVGGALPDIYADAIAAHLPLGTRVKLSGVGHQIHGGEPATMARLVTGFLETLD